MPDYLFVSYRSTEREFALQLAKGLQLGGLPVWMDVLKGIQPGDDWVQLLQDALNTSAAGVACVSPEYVKSKYCRRELQRLDMLGKPIFPVQLISVPKMEWPLEIQSAQYVDFADWQNASQFAHHLSTLVTVIKEKTNITAAPSAEMIEPNGIPLQSRTFEDQVETTLTTSAKLSGIAERKAVSLGKQLELAYQQFDAATEALLMTLNAADIPRLENQVRYYEREALRIESELRLLQG